MMSTPRIDVCVSTYRRPQLLPKLLDSLAQQRTRSEFAIAVNIVDNDPEGSARGCVASFRDRLNISYDIQPVPNLSMTRNRSVSMARGEYIAFIDDDEYASDTWLLSLLEAMVRFEADVVHGPVIPYFDPRAPRIFHESRAYSHPNPETGATEGFVQATNNCLMKSSLTRRPVVFDESYGVTGGEDSELFARLRSEGKKAVWARQAITHELVPLERTSIRWLLRRKFRTGCVYARYHTQHNPAKLRRERGMRLKRILRGSALLPLAAAGVSVAPAYFFARLHDVVFNVGVFGQLIFGASYEEYARTKRPTRTTR